MLLLLSKPLACLAIEVVCLLEGRTGKQGVVGPSRRNGGVANSCHRDAARLATGERNRQSDRQASLRAAAASCCLHDGGAEMKAILESEALREARGPAVNGSWLLVQ